MDIRKLYCPVTPPCKGCEKRKIACHDHCEGYLAYRKRLEVYRKQEKKDYDSWREAMDSAKWGNYEHKWFKNR